MIIYLNLPKSDFKLKRIEGYEYIFDEVRKKYIKLTPEEWVRQNLVHYLNIYKNYPISLISIEHALIYNGMKKRADFYKCDKSQINRISSTNLNQKAKRPLKTGFILDKSIKELGYKPHSFEEGLNFLEKQLN